MLQKILVPQGGGPTASSISRWLASRWRRGASRLKGGLSNASTPIYG